MKIKYYLIDNQMTEDQTDFRAQVTSYETVTEKELFEYITRKGSAITTAEVMANYREIIEAHEYFLKQGYGINTEFLNIRPSIQGVFTDKDDTFDPLRHQIRFSARLGKYYNETASNVSAEKVAMVSNDPLPGELEDVTSGTINETITPGGTAVLEGLRMKFDQEDANQGIFFIDSNNAETRVDRIITQRTQKVVFVIPAGLAAGSYSLEVRVLPSGNKNMKKAQLKDKLTI